MPSSDHGFNRGPTGPGGPGRRAARVPDSYTRVFVHCVWSTWDRAPDLVGEVEATVYRSLRAECARMGVEVLALSGVADHVHLLVRLPPSVSLAGVMKQCKGASSHLVTTRVTRVSCSAGRALTERSRWRRTGFAGSRTTSLANASTMRRAAWIRTARLMTDLLLFIDHRNARQHPTGAGSASSPLTPA